MRVQCRNCMFWKPNFDNPYMGGCEKNGIEYTDATYTCGYAKAKAQDEDQAGAVLLPGEGFLDYTSDEGL